MFIILKQGDFMCGKVKYALIYEMKKSNKYNKYYYHLCDVAVGYVDGDCFLERNNKYKIFPASLDDKFTVCVYDIEPLVIKNPKEKLEDLLDKRLFEDYDNYYQLYYSEQNDECMLKKVQGKNIIAECDKIFLNIDSYANNDNYKVIYQDLCHTIIGQDDVLKGVFAHIVANKRLNDCGLPKDKIKKMKCNIFLNGGTGTGKTFMIDEITKRLGIKYIKVDANDYTAAGYVGEDVNNIIYDLYQLCNENLEQAETSIIVIDEVDKLACLNNDEEITTKAVQAALLTLMEGKKITIGRKSGESVVFDTSRLTIVAMGACAGIEKIAEKRIAPSTLGFGQDIAKSKDNKKIIYEPEDYIKYGFMPEFIGRFPAIYQTNELEIEDFIRIMTDSNYSPYLLQQELFSIFDCPFNLSDEQIREIAVAAKKLNTGARGIKKVIEQTCEDLLFKVVVDEPKKEATKRNQKRLTQSKNKGYHS